MTEQTPIVLERNTVFLEQVPDNAFQSGQPAPLAPMSLAQVVDRRHFEDLAAYQTPYLAFRIGTLVLELRVIIQIPAELFIALLDELFALLQLAFPDFIKSA